MSTTITPYYYDAQKYAWFTPVYVLANYDLLIRKYGANNLLKGDFKRAREMRAVAILLMGLYKEQGIIYYMQAFKESNSPDVVTVRLTERVDKPILGEFVEVEVVTFGQHSKEKDVVEFLKNSKLSPKKSYDALTVILCEIDKRARIDYKQIHSDLAALNPKSHIYIMGRPELNLPHVFQIFCAWPQLQSLNDIDVISLAKAYPKPHIFHLIMSSERKITFTKGNFKKPSLLEIFGLDENYINQKYPPLM